MSKKTRTIEFASSEDFAYANRMGFTTEGVQDSNIKKMYAHIMALVDAGKITPERAGDDAGNGTVVACYFRVRESNPDNATAPSIPGFELGGDELVS